MTKQTNNRICSNCLTADNYHAKNLCRPCYQKALYQYKKQTIIPKQVKYNRTWRAKNRAKYLETMANYRNKNRERIREIGMKYVNTHRDEINARRRARYQAKKGATK